MMRSSRYIVVVFVVLAFAKAYPQQSLLPILSREEAKSLMLENNYGIQIAENDEEIAENNQSVLNSRYLPSLQGTAAADVDETDSRTDFGAPNDPTADPRDPIMINDAETRTYNAAIALNYTLFDGLGRLYNYKRLKEQYNLSQLQARETIENTTVQLMSVYLEIARLTENLDVLKETLDISKSRLTRVDYQFDYGLVSKLEVLNARVDINTDSVNVLNASQQLENTKRDLNVLLNRELSQNFTVDTTVTLLNELRVESLLMEVNENNVRLLQSASNVQISDYDIKTTRALMLPRVGLTGSYGWNRTENPRGPFFPSNTRESTSLRVGASLTWDIFDGGLSITGIRNSKIAYENEVLFKKQIEQEVARDIANALGNYRNAITVYEMQEQNVITNKNNFERTQEQFKLGQVNSIEFRQAQINLLNAGTSKNLAKYDAKLAEYQLLQFSGQLLNIEL
ncbi:MAG: TolC family protein [Nonlabens sp.]